MNNGYFDVTFAVNGTLTAIPDPTQANGTVSYNQGFPVSYSTPVTSGGYNFPRAQFNQLMNDITTALQFLQQNGASNFITTSMNNGTPYSYNLGAVVMYNAGSGLQGWLSTAAANTTTPGAGGANWVPLTSGRAQLSGTTNFYVATTGNDSNAGTSGSPWLTLQHAINYIADNLDLAGNTVNINMANGTYSTGAVASAAFVGGGIVQIIGDAVTAAPTPPLCIISVTSADCISASNGAVLSVKGLTCQTSVQGNGLNSLKGGQIITNGNMSYGSMGGQGSDMTSNNGGRIEIDSSFSTSGSKVSTFDVHASCSFSVAAGITCTLIGTPVYSGAFASATKIGFLEVTGVTYSGGGSGEQYILTGNSLIDTNGSTTNWPTGLSGDTTNTGGQIS